VLASLDNKNPNIKFLKISRVVCFGIWTLNFICVFRLGFAFGETGVILSLEFTGRQPVPSSFDALL
jgi:hypothetical protein